MPPDDAERAVATVRAALAADGPLSRYELRDRVAAAGVRAEGRAMVHILALASIRGLIVRGPAAGRDQAFVLARDWLGAPPPVMSREAALGELARRYLAGHAPAADRDLGSVGGHRAADARLGLARCGAVRRAEDWPGCGQAAARGLPGCRRRGCGAFDPLLLGWASRDPVHRAAPADRHRRRAVRPFALAGGRAVATWTVARGQVALAPFTRFNAGTRAALAAKTRRRHERASSADRARAGPAAPEIAAGWYLTAGDDIPNAGI